MVHLKLALDWTPNINHIGFFVAKEQGFYKKQGINLDIVDPSTDNYAITPAKKVELGLADFALCPTESIISYNTKSKPFDLIAIAALLQEDLSAIVVKNKSGIESPKDLDGKTYSSFKARYEDGIVREMIKNDGGTGSLNIVYPEKLGIWDTLLNDKADSTWIFLNWEGIAASKIADQLRFFKMKDYQIPYSYSPVIAGSQSRILNEEDHCRKFLAASKEGFLYAQENAQASIDILRKYLPASDAEIDLEAALQMTAPHFGKADEWGLMNESAVANFITWIKDKGLEQAALQLDEITTNKYLV